MQLLQTSSPAADLVRRARAARPEANSAWAVAKLLNGRRSLARSKKERKDRTWNHGKRHGEENLEAF